MFITHSICSFHTFNIFNLGITQKLINYLAPRPAAYKFDTHPIKSLLMLFNT